MEFPKKKSTMNTTPTGSGQNTKATGRPKGSEPPKILTTNPRISNKLENIKKVAVTKPGQQALFLELDQNRPLAAIIQDICDKWGLTDAEDFALQFSDPNRQAYITERNRNEIQNGNVLQLNSSPAKTAHNILEKLRTLKSEDRLEALKQLSILSSDSTFAMEFINKDGHLLIIKFVVDGKQQGDPLSYILKSFVSLMDHNVVSWDILEADFTKKVTDIAVNSKTVKSCLQPVLEILESVVLHCSDLSKHSVIEQVMTPEKIMEHLKSNEVQKGAMALLNALFLKAGPEKKKKISHSVHTKAFRNVIISNVIGGARTLIGDMAHQLYVLQTHMLNMHEERMKMPADPNDPEVQKNIEYLRRSAFDIDNDSSQPGTRKSNLFRKLGFEDQNVPANDFKNHTPPGILALDNVYYFAHKHEENYVKVVLENSSRADEHDCPFIQASIMLTKILCDILNIGEPPQEQGQVYYPMFFNHDKPFEEFFCICIQLLNKTWREMRASTEDFQKVLGVVKEQIIRALDIQPTSFDAFRTRLNQLTYAEIIKLWEMDRQTKEEWESQAKPIVELRQQITPEIVDLIKQQRLNYLMNGGKFPKYTVDKGRSKDKFWYWRLAPNQKTFHFADCLESANPPIEQLTNKLQISEIKSLLTGKDCPHVKEKQKGKAPNTNLCFAIVPQTANPDSLERHCFVAANEEEFGLWTDGINVLLGNEMTSLQVKHDLEMLLSMEIKIRLLDAEGITIPTDPPSIPPPPDNYDFAYTSL